MMAQLSGLHSTLAAGAFGGSSFPAGPNFGPVFGAPGPSVTPQTDFGSMAAPGPAGNFATPPDARNSRKRERTPRGGGKSAGKHIPPAASSSAANSRRSADAKGKGKDAAKAERSNLADDLKSECVSLGADSQAIAGVIDRAQSDSTKGTAVRILFNQICRACLLAARGAQNHTMTYCRDTLRNPPATPCHLCAVAGKGNLIHWSNSDAYKQARGIAV